MKPSTLALPPTVPMGLFSSPLTAVAPGTPRHLALVLQGHRSWALGTDLPYTQVIAAAAGRLLELIDFCALRKLSRVTIHLFSDDLCRLPPGEHVELVGTLLRYAVAGSQNINRNNVSLRIEGSLVGLDRLTKALLVEAIRRTQFNTGLQLNVRIHRPRLRHDRAADWALAAPAPVEIRDRPAESIEVGFEPDLVVRTGGPLPVHRGMVWNTQKTALYFTDTPWPRFGASELCEALDWFARPGRAVGLQAQALRHPTHTAS